MRRILIGCLALLILFGNAHANEPMFADQGAMWTPAARADFYTRDQGSKMIPLSWMKALKQSDGSPFLADRLGRYGYLPNMASQEGLPVGFTASGPTGSKVVGMNCAACHTREITVGETAYRIDGGPAIVDFQSLLADLDTAMGNVLVTEAAFSVFASQVLGPSTSTKADVDALRKTVDLWYLRYNALMSKALPAAKWGPGRADAVGMIFNRLTGLDLGKPPSYLIRDNIRPADAPTRYPFIWNSPIQDKTQWPGFADNGSDTLALARNLGQVLGVFATFAPRNGVFFVDYLSGNSTNFDGLAELEHLVKKIGPPKWPWVTKPLLAARGKEVFERATSNGSCKSCHGIFPGTTRSLIYKTWKTPVMPVRTDTRQYQVLQWDANTGALEGAYIPFLTEPLKEKALSIDILKTAVIGSIADYFLFGSGPPPSPELRAAQSPIANPMGGGLQEGSPQALPLQLRELSGAFNRVPSAPGVEAQAGQLASESDAPYGSYEARVLQGIWATAPYLHNGSVPTLADLLKPAADRPASFKVGPAYDTERVGLALAQTKFDQTMVTTDCSDVVSGNSRCGHEYGTDMSKSDKEALLEYLKTL